MSQQIPGRGFSGKQSVVRCAMCEIRMKQAKQALETAHQHWQKIEALKDELTRTQQANAKLRETRGSQELVETEYRVRKKRFHDRARVMIVFMQYVRGVLAMLKTMRDHPQGGFCQFCDGADGQHQGECVLVKVLDDPASVVMAQADVDEEQLPIPQELRTVELKKLIETPWEIDKDPSRECDMGGCHTYVVPGTNRCAKHLAPSDGGRPRCVVLGCSQPPHRGGVRCSTHS